MKTTSNELANAIRALSMDAVQAANSGHPGMPMGMAEIAVALWNRHLRHHPANPKWADRDRFVLSNGHGSMLLYSLLHLTGYALPMDELRRFRQLHSMTPGHPEYGCAPGVETTTGPLGQGIANAVGMALAEKLLAAEFNRPGLAIVDHHTYVFLGDGCLMEGISHEACSLAGTLKLGKLIALYDDNGISIDGKVKAWFTDDTPKRFEAYGWHVIASVDGHDVDAVDRAIRAAKAVTDRPSLICCKTVIGKGAPNKAGSHDAHGAALGEKEVAATREAIGWNHPPFEVPKSVYEGWDARARGAGFEREWTERFGAYEKQHPELAREFRRRMAGDLPASWKAHCDALLSKIDAKAETIATRKASQNAIEGLAPALPEFVGGSADLTWSNLTMWSAAKQVSAADGGSYVSYGVREFGMAAIGNGIALHGGLIPFGGTFLTFSDYARSALRMAALMKLRNIFVFTHDSIGLGEDGPTHQAVEHVSSLRLIPNLDVWRPCDTVESALAWIKAVDANMLTPIELIKATVDGMAARGFGRIINITSSAVKAPIDILGLSNGARCGLTGFVAGVSRSKLAAQGVTMNNLLPGAFDTDRLRGIMQGAAERSGQALEAVMAARRNTIPARRFGTVQEFGAICAFLCSQQAGYINGQNVLADGGAYPGTF